MTSDTKNALQQAAQLAQDYLSDVAERPVGVPVAPALPESSAPIPGQSTRTNG